MEYIYVLRLEEDHYYVGKTSDLGRRYLQHLNSEGSKWTQVYKPLSIVETHENKHELDEEMTTLDWMDKKGVDMVRGDCFTNIRLSDQERAFITKKINTMKKQCYICSEQGHFANDCPKNINYKNSIELLSINDLKARRKFKWLIKNLIPEGSLACMYGLPGCGKTFLCLDMGLHIAHGIQWNGSKVNRGIVYYINAEGMNGMYNRVQAWHNYHKIPLDNTPFFVIEMYKHCLHKRQFSDDFIKMAQAQEKRHGCRTALIIVDTLSHALSGLEENSSTDISKLMKEILYINGELSSSTMFVHHSNKSRREIRGSSAILAAIDTSMSVTRMGNKVDLQVEKQKDGKTIEMNFFIDLNENSCVMRMI